MASNTEDKKRLKVGQILVRAEKLAFDYRLSRKDKGDWLRDKGYRDRLFQMLWKLTLPELNESNWPDEKICDIIELITRDISEPQSSPSQSSNGFVVPPLSPLPSSPGYGIPGGDILQGLADINRTDAETDLLREVTKDIRNKRHKKLY